MAYRQSGGGYAPPQPYGTSPQHGYPQQHGHPPNLHRSSQPENPTQQVGNTSQYDYGQNNSKRRESNHNPMSTSVGRPYNVGYGHVPRPGPGYAVPMYTNRSSRAQDGETIECHRCEFIVAPLHETFPTWKNHLIAGIIFLLGLSFLIFVPYCVPGFGLPVLRCPNCGAIISTSQRTSHEADEAGHEHMELANEEQ